MTHSPTNANTGNPHSIRLNAQWHRMVADSDGNASPAIVVSMPDQVILDNDAASIVYERRFNSPTGLDGTQRVSLASNLLQFADKIELNGQSIGDGHQGHSIDITNQIRPYNRLRLQFRVTDTLVLQLATASVLLTIASDA